MRLFHSSDTWCPSHVGLLLCSIIDNKPPLVQRHLGVGGDGSEWPRTLLKFLEWRTMRRPHVAQEAIRCRFTAKIRWPNVVCMLGPRRRPWVNIKSTIWQFLVLAVINITLIYYTQHHWPKVLLCGWFKFRTARDLLPPCISEGRTISTGSLVIVTVLRNAVFTQLVLSGHVHVTHLLTNNRRHRSMLAFMVVNLGSTPIVYLCHMSRVFHGVIPISRRREIGITP